MHNHGRVAEASSEFWVEHSAALQRELGEAIRRARIEHNMTQELLAERAGVSRASIANIERGDQGVSVPLFLRIAAALEIDSNELLSKLQLLEPHEPAEIPESLQGQVPPGEARWVASVIDPGSR